MPLSYGISFTRLRRLGPNSRPTVSKLNEKPTAITANRSIGRIAIRLDCINKDYIKSYTILAPLCETCHKGSQIKFRPAVGISDIDPIPKATKGQGDARPKDSHLGCLGKLRELFRPLPVVQSDFVPSVLAGCPTFGCEASHRSCLTVFGRLPINRITSRPSVLPCLFYNRPFIRHYFDRRFRSNLL